MVQVTQGKMKKEGKEIKGKCMRAEKKWERKRRKMRGKNPSEGEGRNHQRDVKAREEVCRERAEEEPGAGYMHPRVCD